MLDIINVEKTFNPGTINEKKALNGINLHLDEGVLSPLSAVMAQVNPPCLI